MTDTGMTETMPWSMTLIDDSEDDKAEVRRLLLRGSERQYNFTEAQTGASAVADDLPAADGLADVDGEGGLVGVASRQARGVLDTAVVAVATLPGRQGHLSRAGRVDRGP